VAPRAPGALAAACWTASPLRGTTSLGTRRTRIAGPRGASQRCQGHTSPAADVTEPSDISVDGYVGKAFQRTAPADMSGCTTREGGSRFSGDAVLPSWESSDGINMGYQPGQIETLWVLDIDGTVVVISTELWPGPSATAHADFADAVLDSIRIHRP
jgi:hypothetical protein